MIINTLDVPRNIIFAKIQEQSDKIQNYKGNPHLYEKFIAIAYALYSETDREPLSIGPTDFDIVILPVKLPQEYESGMFCLLGTKDKFNAKFYAAVNLEQSQGAINKIGLRNESKLLYRDIVDMRDLALTSEVEVEPKILLDLILV